MIYSIIYTYILLFYEEEIKKILEGQIIRTNSKNLYHIKSIHIYIYIFNFLLIKPNYLKNQQGKLFNYFLK